MKRRGDLTVLEVVHTGSDRLRHEFARGKQVPGFLNHGKDPNFINFNYIVTQHPYSTKPLTMVVAFFTQFVDTPIQDYTSELRDAPCSNGPVATSALSDVWRATIRKSTHVAVKCVRTAVSGNDKVVKVCAGR
jgi:hypothetical protein